MEVNLDFPGTTRIGAYDWHSSKSSFDVSTFMLYSRQFVILKDGFAIIISIPHHEASESAEEVLAMFSALQRSHVENLAVKTTFCAANICRTLKTAQTY